MTRAGVLGLIIAATILGSVALPSTAVASEGGGSQVNNGMAGFRAGLMPGPGTYFENFSLVYHSSRFNDDHGTKSPVWSYATYAAEALRFTHITDVEILGGTWGAYITMPFAWGEIRANGRRQSKAGQGDLTIDPFLLGWHFGTLHVQAGVDFALPTGAYDQRDMVNIGRNYFGIRPSFGVTYRDEDGIELSAKFVYAYNTENRATRYRTGQEFQTDYVAALHLGDWALGVGGYVYQQISDDVVNGTVVPHRRGRVFALGPQVRYVFARQVAIAASWDHEMGVRNRPSGEAGWLKLAVPF